MSPCRIGNLSSFRANSQSTAKYEMRLATSSIAFDGIEAGMKHRAPKTPALVAPTIIGVWLDRS